MRKCGMKSRKQNHPGLQIDDEEYELRDQAEIPQGRTNAPIDAVGRCRDRVSTEDMSLSPLDRARNDGVPTRDLRRRLQAQQKRLFSCQDTSEPYRVTAPAAMSLKRKRDEIKRNYPASIYAMNGMISLLGASFQFCHTPGGQIGTRVRGRIR